MKRFACFITVFMTMVAVGIPVEASAAVRSHTSVSPILRLVSLPHYPLAVAGSGWAKKSPVTLSVRTAGGEEVIRFHSTNQGAFLVGVVASSGCNDVTFTAQDAGLSVSVQTADSGKRPQRQCPVPLDSGPPVLKVLKGKLIKPRKA